MAKINPFKFLQEVRAEADKVTWPTRRETLITTIMVFVMVAVASVLLPGRGSDHSYRHHLHPRDRRLGDPRQGYWSEHMAKRWYIVHAYSNFENKVAESIREQAKQRGLEDLFERDPGAERKGHRGAPRPQGRHRAQVFPGYVLVKMDLTDEAYHLIKNTPKVTGFLGTDKKPMPISDAEAERILQQVQEGIDRPKPSVSFEVGEQVRVSDGPFASFNGTVEEVDEGRSRVKVAVSIFGRATPVELEFGQVEKV